MRRKEYLFGRWLAKSKQDISLSTKMNINLKKVYFPLYQRKSSSQKRTKVPFINTCLRFSRSRIQASNYDGGFLNDIFALTPNSTIEYRNISVWRLLPRVVAENLFRGGRHSLDIFHWLPSNLTEGYKASNQVAVLTGATIFVGLVFLSLPICVIVLSCISMHRPSRHIDHRANVNRIEISNERFSSTPPEDAQFYGDAYWLDKAKGEALKSFKKDDRRANRVRACHIATFVITFFLLLSLVVMIWMMFVSGRLVTSFLGEKANQTVSVSNPLETKANIDLLGGVRLAFAQTADFLSTGVSLGNASSADFLISVNNTFITILKKHVSVAVDDLLVMYGVQPLIETAENLQVDVKILETNMEIIRTQNQQVSSAVSRLVGAFGTINGLVLSGLRSTCAVSMGPEIDDLCKDLKERASILITHFNATAINVEPPTVLNFIFKTLGVDLNQILDQFSEFTGEIIKVKDEFLTRVAQFLDFNEIFGPLNKAWSTIDKEARSLNNSMTKVVEQLSDSLAELRTPLYALIYTAVTLFIATLLANFTIAILYVFEARKTQIFYLDRIDTMDSSRVCGNCCHVVHGVVFLVFFLGVTAMVVLLLPTSVLLSSNGCTYLVNQPGVAETDYVLNSFISTQVWPGVINEIDNAINASITEFLQLGSPRDVVNASTVVCGLQSTRERQMGLLSAIGWNSLVSIPALVESPEIQEKLQDGESKIKTEIKNLNLSDYIPNNLEELAKTAKNLTTYFDDTDYQSSIDELSPTRFPAEKLFQYANDLETLINEIQALGLPVSDLLVQSLDLIRKNLNESITVGVEVTQLRDAFIAVQNRRNLTKTIDSLVQGVKAVEIILRNDTALLAPVTQVYWNLVDGLKVELDVELNPPMETFVQGLLPCQQLYQATQTLLSVVCLQNGGISRMYTWSYILACTTITATLVFFFTFLLGYIQSYHFHRLNHEPVQPAYITEPAFARDRYGTVPVPVSFYHPSEEKIRQSHRLATPIPPVYEYADRRDFDLGAGQVKQLSVEDVVSSESEEQHVYEAPIPRPRNRTLFDSPEPPHSVEVEEKEAGETDDQQVRSEEETASLGVESTDHDI